MYCAKCGKQTEGSSMFCAECQATQRMPGLRRRWLIPVHILGISILVTAAFFWGKESLKIQVEPLAQTTAPAVTSTAPSTPVITAQTATAVTAFPTALTTMAADTPAPESSAPAITAEASAPVYPDTMAVVFQDREVEAWIRANYVKKSGTITAGDMKEVTIFEYDPANNPQAVEGRIKTLDDLKYCVNLEWLRILDQPIRDIECLRKLDYLKTLFLHDTNVKDLSPLAGKERLTWVWLYGNPVKDTSPVLGLPNLTNFNGNVSDISALKKTKSLRYFYCGRKLDDITPLFGHENLTDLSLVGITDQEFRAMLGKLKQLKSIRIESSILKDESLALLSQFTSLENLTLDNCGIKDISGLSFLRNVNDLRLTHNKIKDITPLSGLTMVSYCLDIRYNQITDYSPLQNARIKSLWVNPGSKSKVFAILEKNGCEIHRAN